MFGHRKPIVFDPYAHRRKRRLPRWLILLLLGVGLGAAGVLGVQEKLLPPRLSAGESSQLRRDHAEAQAERQRLQTELAGLRASHDAAVAEQQRLAAVLAEGDSGAERARAELAALIDALPPDPRGGAVEIRAARFGARDGRLSYDLALSRAASTPLAATLQLVVAGATAAGSPLTLTLDPQPLSLGRQAVVRGSLPLPAGFRAEQTTVRILDRASGGGLGMRVLPVR